MFIEINLWTNYVGADFPFGNSLFGAVRLTKNADPNKYYYSGYGIDLIRKENFYCPMLVGLVEM